MDLFYRPFNCCQWNFFVYLHLETTYCTHYLLPYTLDFTLSSLQHYSTKEGAKGSLLFALMVKQIYSKHNFYIWSIFDDIWIKEVWTNQREMSNFLFAPNLKILFACLLISYILIRLARICKEVLIENQIEIISSMEEA